MYIMKTPLLAAAGWSFVLLFLGAGIGQGQSLYINEFMAANSTTIADPDYHDYADWIELYNAGSSEANLKGYTITDAPSQPQKYRFTSDVIIPAHSWVVLWADDRNTRNHGNFKLSASGEFIGLYDSSGIVVDTITFGVQTDDVAYGRVPDGSAGWYRLSPASPGAANLSSQILDKLEPPRLSQSSGFYALPLTLTCTHPDDRTTLHYTIDGYTPSAGSPEFPATLRVDTTIVLRVRAFKDGSQPSTTVTMTYMVQEPTQLPLFSLVTDPENFFSDTSGIYVAGTNGIVANCSTAPRNWNQDWERPVDLEFFEADHQSVFKVSAGVKIYGGCARLYPEKSLAFYFRDVYGSGKLHYKLFADLPYTEYNNFVLRSSGQDWWRTMIRDGMAQTLIKQGMNADVQDYRPSILFINGQYWGIHNIREKLNEHYVNQHYGVDPDSVDLVEISKGVEANNGDLVAYNALVNYLSTNSLAQQSNYDYVASLVDVDEYIDYTIAEIYGANGDWPGANMKLWRERKPTGKWRWMVYDLDFTFGGNAQGQYNTNTLAQATATNGPSWPNPPWSTLMLRRMLENPGFRNEFIQRFAVHLNTTFEKEHVVDVIDSLARGIQAEIPRHKTRWAQSLSIGSTWSINLQVLRDFAATRPAAARSHFISQFSLAGTYAMIVSRNETERGKVFTHGVEVSKNGAVDTFFCGIPLKIKAIPSPGYQFVRWEGATSSTTAETTLVLTTNSALMAVFEPGSTSVESNGSEASGFRLLQNYPNPFNPTTTIRFTIAGVVALSGSEGPATKVRLVVYDLLGREVAVLVEGKKEPGLYEVPFDGSKLPSGVYICKLIAGGFMESRRMVLIK
jgi:hypothetical protein